MSVTIGQQAYSLFPTQAQPGQLADLEDNSIQSFIAGEAIPPGRMLQSTDGVTCILVQNTTAASTTAPPTKQIGFSVLMTSREGLGAENLSTQSGGAGFNKGEMVPVLSRGRIFAEWKGTTQSAVAVPHVYHSSTTATDRGKLTDASADNTGGSEVSIAGAVRTRSALAGTKNIILVDVNIPGPAVVAL